jgi:undecaprenyl-diphosphatase
MDWTLAHLVNHAVASRDWLEDPVTLLAKLAVPAFAVVAVGLWLLARPYGPALWKRASASALVAAAVAMLTNQVVSHAWERPRPYTAHPGADHLLAPASPDPSFPSDHAAAAFAIAVAVLLLSRRVGLPLLALAAFVAFSRVALGVHYPTDVLAGAAIGSVAAILVGTAGARWIERLVTLVSRATDPLLARLRLSRAR